MRLKNYIFKERKRIVGLLMTLTLVLGLVSTNTFIAHASSLPVVFLHQGSALSDRYEAEDYTSENGIYLTGVDAENSQSVDSTSWAVASGKLPGGMSLSIVGGLCYLVGVPTEAGAFTFDISVKGATDGVTYKTGDFTLTIREKRVKKVTVIGANNAEAVGLDKTLQMEAVIAPADAADKSVEWSVEKGTGEATIDGNGLLTAKAAGTVTVKAAAMDGSGVIGTMVVTVNEKEPVKITSIVINAESFTVIQGETLQFDVSVLPEDAANKAVKWVALNETGNATINQSGVLTAKGAGTVTVGAAAIDGSGIVDQKTVTIDPLDGGGDDPDIDINIPDEPEPNPEVILVTKIKVESEISFILEGKDLQMTAIVTPQNATEKGVKWAVENGTGTATMNQAGMLTAKTAGMVTVKAIAKDGSKVVGQKEITITAEPVTDYTYLITEGANSQWNQDSDKDKNIVVKVDGDFARFVGVKVNDVLLDPSNYTAEPGNTIITLKAEYLKSLQPGTYNLSIVYNHREVKTTFTVLGKVPVVPQTGDNTSIWLLVGLLILSGGTVGFIVLKKRNQHS